MDAVNGVWLIFISILVTIVFLARGQRKMKNKDLIKETIKLEISNHFLQIELDKAKEELAKLEKQEIIDETKGESFYGTTFSGSLASNFVPVDEYAYYNSNSNYDKMVELATKVKEENDAKLEKERREAETIAWSELVLGE